MKKIIILTIALYLTNFATTQAQSIKWYTWEQAIQASKVQKKKIVVDLYTSWCGWCKEMDKNTFTDPFVVKYLNDNYYPIKFDGESKEEITVDGKVYKLASGGRNGFHELAAQLTGNKAVYPTIVFLDENFNLLQSLPGYKDPTMFELIITYFGENKYQATPWSRYQSEYKSSINRDK
jgi:thioredoxin-related protein